MGTVAFGLNPVVNPHGGVTVGVYPDRAGKMYLAGRLKLTYSDYEALARMFGLDPVPEAKVPARTDTDLATAIAADAAEALRGVSLQQAQYSLVEDWNKAYRVGQRVLWRPMDLDLEAFDPDEDVTTTSTTRSPAFLLGGIATLWIDDWAMPVSLSHVHPLRDKVDQ